MLNWIFLILVLIAIIGIWIIIYDTHRFVIRHYSFSSNKIREKVRFVMLSDLHNKQYGKGNEVLLSAVDECKPDGILLPGDMMTSLKKESFEPAIHLLEELAKKYPLYYSYGNHEQKSVQFKKTYGDLGERYEEALKKIGVTPMINTHILLEEKNIAIYGLLVDHSFYQRFTTKPMEADYLENLLGKPEKSCYNILLAHNPEYFPQYVAWGADLVGSGHIHGGLVRLPFLGGVISPAIRFFPKYDGGEFTKENSKMVLGRGIGSHQPDIRVFNPGELIVIDLERKEE